MSWHVARGRFGLTRRVQPAAGPGCPDWRASRGWRRWRYGAAFTWRGYTVIVNRWDVHA